jgi:adenosylhomocysteine nucleosidase
MEREVAPLIKHWPSSKTEFSGRCFRFFENKGLAVIFGGIGPEAARRASEAIITLYRPEVVISAGFAGGLDPGLQVGDTLAPRYVIDASDGSRTDCGSGEGVLVSFGDVADAEQKARLRQAYGADAIDMEAAAVARSAEAHNVKFLACKAISDTSSASLPPIGCFIGSSGEFRTLAFLAHVALRPWLWMAVRRVAIDSALAAEKLSISLAGISASYMADQDTRVLAR